MGTMMFPKPDSNNPATVTLFIAGMLFALSAIVAIVMFVWLWIAQDILIALHWSVFNLGIGGVLLGLGLIVGDEASEEKEGGLVLAISSGVIVTVLSIWGLKILGIVVAVAVGLGLILYLINENL